MCDTGLSRNDFAGFPQHAQPGRYFGGNMVDVITPREAWIEHDTEILELVDPILKVLSKAETLITITTNNNSRGPLMFSHKYYFCFRVVKKQIVTIQPAYDVS